MKKLFSIFLSFVILASILAAQDTQIIPKTELASGDTSTNYGWSASGVVGLNLSQVAFSNWSQGGDNSIAFTIFGDFGFVYLSPDWKWDNGKSQCFRPNSALGRLFRNARSECVQRSHL